MDKHVLSQLEDTLGLIHSGVNAVSGIQSAMAESGLSAEAFTDGLWFIWYALDEQCTRADRLFQQLYHAAGGQTP